MKKNMALENRIKNSSLKEVHQLLKDVVMLTCGEYINNGTLLPAHKSFIAELALALPDKHLSTLKNNLYLRNPAPDIIEGTHRNESWMEYLRQQHPVLVQQLDKVPFALLN